MTRPSPLFLALALTACGGAATPEPTPAAPAVAPAPAAAPAPAPATPPAPTGPADAAAGKVTYDAYCKACHQEDGTGMNGMLAANFKEKGRLDKTDEQLLTSIRDGFQGKTAAMPPWKGTLSDQDMVNVLAHIRATYTAPAGG